MKCPTELRSRLEAEMASGGLRYMLAMYWQGRADKISENLRPLLEWITKNGLPAEVSATWVKFQSGNTAFLNQNHQSLLNVAMEFAAAAATA